MFINIRLVNLPKSNAVMQEITEQKTVTFEEFKSIAISDFRIACLSREISLIGRKEVLTGKAKFGIFGDGKEIAQIAASKFFQDGDFRSGYYRDQTFAFATGICTYEQFFAQLYAIPDIDEEPQSAGRQMNGHFATRSLDKNGNWKDLTKMKNSSADTSPTASQMVRAVGLGLASKIYREQNDLYNTQFSHNGNEVTFVTIGDASTSEGIFWESLNAAGVLKIPMAIFVWDDGYGISVPQKYQTTKENISELTVGFQLNEEGKGVKIYSVAGWDYPALIKTFEEGITLCRREHIPVLFHVKELTQPQGHSTSGSHERYKTKERLEWETQFDCITQMKNWLISNSISDEITLNEIISEAKSQARDIQKSSWAKHVSSIKSDNDVLFRLLDAIQNNTSYTEKISNIIQSLKQTPDAVRRDLMKTARQILFITSGEITQEREQLLQWVSDYELMNEHRYNSHLYSVSDTSVLKCKEEAATYSEDSPLMNGFEILNTCFDKNFSKNPYLIAFGEDLGKIGDVNQGFSGLQEKYGESRIFDVGIREATIIGQGIGLAMRGLRPIAEIQYLDYLLYGLQPISDDLATLHYRTAGGQKAPVIIRTRGHRLEGIWHTGSPLGMILHSCRGVYICVPRNMVQAAGMYNTLLASDDPAIVIECLNGYRLKEKLPDNIDTFKIAFGKPEILQNGTDITVVSYGSTLRIIQDAITDLNSAGISVELIDVQTLLPFDLFGVIAESIKKTNRILFIDEDVPGGATAFMQQQVFQDESLFRYLDAFPKCLSAKPNRSAYASDGDYFCKPNAEDIYETIYMMMNDVDPETYPAIR